MKAVLTFRTGHHRGQVLEFDAPRTVVLGRSSQSDIQVYDERISRRHCAIRVEGNTIRLKDMGSNNGTFVNGAEVREAVLAHGDVITIGSTEVEVSFQSSLESTIDLGSRAGASAVCSLCQREIPPDQVHLAAEHRGRYLCQVCSPKIQVPGYRLDRRLGEGAMGVVYLAIQEQTGQPVALKVLKTRGPVTDEDRARFIREVQTSEQLEHPHIIRVIDHGEAPPYLYYVMEYVPGRSLSEWIKTHGLLPLPSVLRVAVQVASALEHARQRNVVHRDIKPENIIVQGDGHAKLADFGLAKNVATSGNSGLTRPGEGLGTLPYMPPEQIEDALFADHRADVYSFGATIYHMLTGRPPFIGKTPLDFFIKIREGTPPPISDFRQDVPPLIEDMLARSMAKNPEERYASADEMARIMKQFLASEFDSRQTAG